MHLLRCVARESTTWCPLPQLLQGPTLAAPGSGQGAGHRAGGPGRAAQPADEERAGDRAGSGDDRAPGLREARCAGRDGGNSRNGIRAKTVLTEIGPVEIEVPRDRDGTFDPQIVRKRQRRLTGVDQIVLSLTAGVDDRGDRRALRRGLRRDGLARTRSRGSPRRSSGRWPSGPTGPWTGSTR